jgi:hypothetical protein
MAPNPHFFAIGFTKIAIIGRSQNKLLSAEKAKVLFTTGYTPNAIVHQGRLDAGVQLLAKPFTYAGPGIKDQALAGR